MLDLSLISDSPSKLATLLLGALLIGMSKTGIQGINTISIPFLALAFGGKESTGIILPMLCFADLLAVCCYHRSAQWRHIVRLLPMAVCGFFAAILADKIIPPEHFKRLMALCILAGLAVMYWSKNKSAEKKQKIFASPLYAQSFGLLGGFTTMIGNAAGPVMAVYMLSAKLPKYAFVGTSAWFFLCVNYLKLPLQIFVWDNINWQGLSANIISIPFIIAGAALGILFVKLVPETFYTKFVVVSTIISSLLLLY